MQPFKFQRATNMDAATQAFTAGAESKYLAGGQTLIPVLKQRLASPSDLISLAGIPDLAGIKVDATSVTIGAMTRHADVAASADVRRAIPALAELASGIGDPHVRNRGTMGGSLANNDPAADYPAAALGLGATIKTNKRSIAADDYFQGLFTTALEEGEILTAVEYPVPEKAGYMKFPHPASRYCLVGVMVSRSKSGVRVAVTGAGQEGVFRVKAFEDALAKSFDEAALTGLKVDAGNLMTDIHAPADYRAHLIGVLARRAVKKALA